MLPKSPLTCNVISLGTPNKGAKTNLHGLHTLLNVSRVDLGEGRRDQREAGHAEDRERHQRLESQGLRPASSEFGHGVLELVTDRVPDVDVQGGLDLVQPLGSKGLADLVRVGGEELGANQRCNDTLVTLNDLELLGGSLGKGGDHRLATEESDILPKYGGGKYLAL